MTAGNLLRHSPADILRWLLIQLNYGTDPDLGLPWPVYATNEPDRPDECITIKDTTGLDDGRDNISGERNEHQGFQVRLRSRTPKDGYEKIRAIAVGLDESVFLTVVVVDGSSYRVHSVSRKGSVIPLGKQTPLTKRNLFTVNAMAHILALD